MTALLQLLETYYDAVPRPRGRHRGVGPFTLVRVRVGWPYYARPTLGGTVDDRHATTYGGSSTGSASWRCRRPSSGSTRSRRAGRGVEATGISVERCPLLVLDGSRRGGCRRNARDDRRRRPRVAGAVAGSDLRWRSLTAAPRRRRRASPRGTRARTGSTPGRRRRAPRAAARRGASGAAAFVAEEPDLGAVGGGSATPVGEVTEIAGVGVLPAFRRRGLAAQVTYVLAADALGHGVTTVFCSAGPTTSPASTAASASAESVRRASHQREPTRLRRTSDLRPPG